MRVFFSLSFRQNSSLERLSIRDTCTTRSREKREGNEAEERWDVPISSSDRKLFTHKRGAIRGNLGAEDGRTVSGALSLEIWETRCRTPRARYSWWTSPRALDRLSKSEAFGQECSLRSVELKGAEEGRGTQ